MAQKDFPFNQLNPQGPPSPSPSSQSDFIEQIRAAENTDLIKRISHIEENLERLSKILVMHSVSINTLKNAEWEIKSPLIINVEEKKGSDDFIACLYDADVYGYGDNIPDALDDLKEAIVNQFIFLSENEDSLGDMPRSQLNYLKQIIVRKNARS